MDPKQKEIKIKHESDANSNATTIYFYCKIKKVCNLSKMPQYMKVKLLNLDLSCFKFHVDRQRIKIQPNCLILADQQLGRE